MTGWGVEERDFFGFAGDGFVPGGEDEETGHEVVVGIKVVEPEKVKSANVRQAWWL